MPSVSGRRRALPYEVLRTILRAHREEVLQDGVIQPPSHQCWVKVADLLRESSEVRSTGNLPKHIWTLLKCRRISLDSDEEEEDAEQETNIHSLSCDEDAEQHVSGRDDALHFTIAIPEEDWSLLKESIPYHSSDRVSATKGYGVLKPQWTSTITQYIYERTRTELRCTFSFKRCKTYSSGAVYLKMQGYCNMCGSILKGESLLLFLSSSSPPCHISKFIPE